jgi:hypothetical protein
MDTRVLHPGLSRIAGLIAGIIAGAAAVILCGTAVAHRIAQATSAPFMEATHLPPLLTADGERVELRYDVYCGDGSATEVDAPCDAEGSVFIRSGDSGAFREIELREELGAAEGRYVAAVPEEIAQSASGFSYHATFRNATTGLTTDVPAGGPDAPQRSFPLRNTIEVDLGAHGFGREREADARVAEASWGDGPTQAALEQGKNLTPIGGSSFDVEAGGSIVVLDEANRRLLRWRGGGMPEAVPLAINGTIADISIGADGTIYVLESTGGREGSALLRTFDRGGVARGVRAIADRPSQVRIGTSGAVVHQSSSAQWTPIEVEGQSMTVSEQLNGADVGRPLPDGRKVVVLRTGDQVRIALMRDKHVLRSWVVRSETPLAEVQLAEPRGTGVVVVTRAFTDVRDEFVVLVLDRRGVVQRFALDSASWAETAPLSRFRLRGNSLYQLGSTPAGLFVDRFDLEVK